MLVASAIGLAGCTPGPAPKSTPAPLFTSEADAFKAAEQVYREYVDATNSNNDGQASADPLEFLGGAALDDALAGVRKREAAGTSVKGHVELVSFRSRTATVDSAVATVDAIVCVDVSNTWLANAIGDNVTPSTRAPQATLSVGFSQSRRHLLITRSEVTQETC